MGSGGGWGGGNCLHRRPWKGSPFPASLVQIYGRLAKRCAYLWRCGRESWHELENGKDFAWPLGVRMISAWPSVREVPSSIPGATTSLFWLLCFVCCFNYSLRQTRLGHFHWTLFFCLLARFLSLTMLFIALNSPNLVHQYWEGQETVKCPNSFDWDCIFK